MHIQHDYNKSGPGAREDTFLARQAPRFTLGRSLERLFSLLPRNEVPTFGVHAGGLAVRDTGLQSVTARVTHVLRERSHRCSCRFPVLRFTSSAEPFSEADGEENLVTCVDTQGCNHGGSSRAAVSSVCSELQAGKESSLEEATPWSPSLQVAFAVYLQARLLAVEG